MLIYRGMWVDPRGGFPGRVGEALHRWVSRKTDGALTIVDGRASGAYFSYYEKVDVQADLTVEQTDEAFRARFTETYPTGKRIATIIRAWPVGQPGKSAPWWVWIDVDALGPGADVIQGAAPSLVKSLHPNYSRIVLVERFAGADAGDALVKELVRTERADTLTLLADAAPDDPHHPELSGSLTRAATQLAGVARIATVDPEAAERIRSELGYRYRLEPGQLRIYLPLLNPDSAADAFRHRYLLPHRFRRNPASAIAEIKAAAASYSSVRRPPPSWDDASAALDTAAGAQTVDPAIAAMVDEMVAAKANAELSAARFAAENDVLRSQLDDTTGDLIGESEQANKVAAKLERTERQLQAALRKLHVDDPAGAAEVEFEVDADPIPQDASGLVDAVEQARKFLGDALVIHPDAGRDLEDLDANVSALAWGNTTWRGFRALHAYALALRGGFGGNFKTWCQTSGSAWGWNPSEKKLAMAESETVRNRFANSRVLPVSTDVEPSGFVFMESHLKIAEGGGDLAPRVYFYVDSPSSTVHVGFVGPHKHMPNTRT